MSLGLHVCVLMRVGRKSLEGLELQGSNLRTMFEVQGWWRSASFGVPALPDLSIELNSRSASGTA